MVQQPTILIADDNPDNIEVLLNTLESFGYQVRVAVNGKAAVESAQLEVPDLILLDIMMPEMDGYQACRRLKSDPRTKDIPVIFISALTESINRVKGIELGAVDFLTKPVQMEEVRARVNVHLELRDKMKELEEFNKILLDREMRVIELKKEVNGLAEELGGEAPYPEVWEETTAGE